MVMSSQINENICSFLAGHLKIKGKTKLYICNKKLILEP